MNERIFRRLFRLAERLEPDRQAIWNWLLHTRIEHLGDRTAVELVFAGEGGRVIEMLEAALQDEAPAVQTGGIAHALRA